jgi:hypothetical protein
LQIVGKAVPLASQPTVEWIGLPMSGDVDVAIDLQHLDEPAKARGSIRISCPAGCRLGDDKAKLTPKPKNSRASAFAGEGIHFGHIDFDSVKIAVDVEDGKAKVTTFDVVSKDVVMTLAGTIELAKVLADSHVDLCLRFGPGPGLEDRQPQTHAALMVTGAPRAGDGMFNIKLTDKLGAPKRLGVVCDGSAPPAPPPTRPELTTGSDDADPPSAADDAEIAKLAEMVKKTSDTTFEVDRATLEKLFANPIALAKGARVVPAMKNGKPQGFKLYAIRPTSLFAHLGLLNGDTITSIAGQSVESADKALEVFVKVRHTKPGERIEVVVERNGAPITLTYAVK